VSPVTTQYKENEKLPGKGGRPTWKVDYLAGESQLHIFTMKHKKSEATGNKNMFWRENPTYGNENNKIGPLRKRRFPECVETRKKARQGGKGGREGRVCVPLASHTGHPTWGGNQKIGGGGGGGAAKVGDLGG